MKKSVTLIGLFVAIAMTSKAQIILYDEHGLPTRHNSGVPTVNFNEDDVTIKSDSVIYNVDIVIKDQFENIMHHSIQTVGPMETTISLPENNVSQKTTIDLYYDKKRLSGFFE